MVQKTIEKVNSKWEMYRKELADQIQELQWKKESSNESIDRLLYLLLETKSSKQKNSKVISKKNASKVKVIKTSLSKKNKTQTVTNELKVSTGNLVSLDYILHEASEDGKVLETTIEDVARNNSIYKNDISYKPMLVMVGTKSVIVGFEKGLMGMKKGEKKIIKISPEEWYGTGERLTVVPKNQIAPVYTLKKPKTDFDDTIHQTINKAQLDKDIKNMQVGQTLTGANGAVAKVIAVTDTDITFIIDNVDNPFYKKTLTIGTTVENQGASFKILSITNNEVTIEVTNKQSPFFNKKFEVGESLTLPQGWKITIAAINGDNITIGEMHPMAGKTLVFEVEVIDIE